MKNRVASFVRNSDVNYFCVSQYNRQIAPVTPKGNMNSDGVIDLVDARLALRHCMDVEYLDELNLQHADFNTDANVTKQEVLDIVKAYNGI